MNAEAEKAQRLAAAMPRPSTFEEASEMQKIILAVMNMTALKELILLQQVEKVVSISF